MAAVEWTDIPAIVNITVALGNGWSKLVDWDFNLTGHTITAVVAHHNTTTAFDVTETDLSAGQVTIALTVAQITAIGAGQFTWYMHDTDNATINRDLLAGKFTVIKYPDLT